MTSQNLLRWGGLAAILAGIMSIILTLPASGVLDMWLHVPQIVLMLLGITGVYLYQHQEIGMLGFLGFLLAFVGTTFFLVTGQVAGFDSLAIGGFFSGLGIILLALGTWKAGKLPRWIPLLWVFGAIIGIPASYLVSIESSLLLISAIFFAMGFIAAGLKLLSA